MTAVGREDRRRSDTAQASRSGTPRRNRHPTGDIAPKSRPFAKIGSGLLRVMLPETQFDWPLDDAVEHIMSGFISLDPHPDVGEGVEASTNLGIRLATLGNGSTSVATTLLESAGVRDNFEILLSVVGAGAWKPAAPAYEYALSACGIDPVRQCTWPCIPETSTEQTEQA
ncbi:hypothetical protein [Rhodococcus sp. IEGM 1318]|uniref:hypothetical protein n=1 Tax=Rhodococcus sp. IEGM 1318 TaxID=3082226 RepID=UPI002952AD8D|nr:hypothetical protein [Rhodococcus sp. IEGM 1318]MDV8009166.1 hypothetical protein [Rhodococcus sp. IEGM 1318]